MQSIPQPRRANLFLYLFLGLILGVLLSALASLVALLVSGSALTWDNILQLHLNDPLFMLIDVYALIFAIVIGLIGSQKDKTEHARAQLQWLNQKRSNDLQEMKDKMIAQNEKFSELEAVISRGKQQWVATFDAVKDLILLTDENGVIMRCNRATGEAFQTGFSQLIGRKINELFLGKQAAENLPDNYLADKPEIQFSRLDGWYQVSRNFLIIDGQQGGWVYVFRDISDRKHDIQELQRLNEYYQLLVENSPIAIVTLTQEERIVDVNQAFSTLFGYNRREVLGWNLDSLICPPAQMTEILTIIQSVRQGEKVHKITRQRQKEGTLVEVEVFGIPVIIGGKQIGSLRLYHDVSGLVASQREALTKGPFVEEGWSLEEELARRETEMIPELQSEPVEIEVEVVEEAGEEAGEGDLEPVAEAPELVEEQAAPEPQDLEAALAPELKRTSVQRSLPIKKIEGIGPAYAEQLSEAGIDTTEDLLNYGKTPKGRQELAETVAIPDKLILKWVNMADLMRVKGIGEEYSELLERAGVDSVRELRNRKPVNLHARLGAVNEELHLVRRLPHLSQVENWIRIANELEPLVTY